MHPLPLLSVSHTETLEALPMDLSKEARILSHLRLNARLGLTDLSKATGIPVSTIFDQLKTTPHIRRYSTLLDFNSLGFGCRALVLCRTTKESKPALGNYLCRHPYVNTLHKVNNGYDFCLEGVFRDLKHLEDFLEHLDESFSLRAKEIHYLLDELSREGFLLDPAQAHATILGKAGHPRTTE